MDEITGAQNVNFVPEFPQDEGLAAQKINFLDQNFPTAQNLGREGIASPLLPADHCLSGTIKPKFHHVDFAILRTLLRTQIMNVANIWTCQDGRVRDIRDLCSRLSSKHHDFMICHRL